MIAVAALLAFAGLTFAQSYYTNQSAPFYLKLNSGNASIDGQYFASWHSGAAFEQLVPDGPKPTDNTWAYYLNYTDSSNTDEGLLTWYMPYGSGNDTLYLSEPLSMVYNPVGDVVVLVFTPDTSSYYTYGFDTDNKLYITGSPDEEEYSPFYHWFTCLTYYGGYRYNALAWSISGKPADPTCQPANVTREFL